MKIVNNEGTAFLSNEMDRNEKIKPEALQKGTQLGVVE